MLARLIEAWTDSTNERSYQPAFLQMLVARGHQVIHNTRHGPLEFGKDVITRDSDGTLCAFQLKGHPGGRLKMKDVASMLDQLNQLLFLHVQHPNVVANAQHRAYLVTNGEIDEEAQTQLAALRAGLNGNTAALSFEVIARGQFLRWAVDLEAQLWPQEVDDWRRLLEILGMDGASPLPVERFIPMLDAILGSRAKKADIRRKVASAAIFTALALRDFSQRENHLAEATAWLVFSTRVLALAERSKLSLKTVDAFVDIAEDAIKTSLVRLAREAQTGPVPALLGLGENVAYHFRLPLLCGIAGLLSFWVEQSDRDLHAGLRTFLAKHTPSCAVWGEGAVPSILMATWALGLTSDLLVAERKLSITLAEMLGRALGKGAPLYGPYWSAESIMIHMLAPRHLGSDLDVGVFMSTFKTAPGSRRAPDARRRCPCCIDPLREDSGYRASWA